MPDVSYYSFERLPRALGEAREQPTIAPDIAVEIWSRDDSRARLAVKIGLCFAFGSRAVVVVDPAVGTFLVYDAPDRGTTFRLGMEPQFAADTDLHIDLGRPFRDRA